MTQHTQQDSQSELEFWEGMFGKSTNAKGNAEGYITYADFTKRLEAYATTRVKEAERLARIDELKNIKLKKYDDGFIAIVALHPTGQYIEHDVRIAELEALTTTTNGKLEAEL